MWTCVPAGITKSESGTWYGAFDFRSRSGTGGYIRRDSKEQNYKQMKYEPIRAATIPGHRFTVVAMAKDMVFIYYGKNDCRYCDGYEPNITRSK